MDKFAVYCVKINIEQGARWKRYFIGRPEKKDVLDAIEDEWLIKRSGINPEDEGGRRIAKSHFDHFMRLVHDNEWPQGSLLPCTYAGLTVGSIRIEHIADAIGTLGSCTP